MTPIHNLAKVWASEVVALDGLKVPFHLKKRKRQLMHRAKKIKTALEMSDHVTPVATELGFIPLLVAGGMAAAAAMTKWITDAKKVTTETQKSQTDAAAVDQLIKSGLTKEQAVSVVLGQKSGDWKKWIFPVGVTLVVGGAMWLLLRSRKNAN